jgi:hypothetical protein
VASCSYGWNKIWIEIKVDKKKRKRKNYGNGCVFGVFLCVRF